MPFPGTSTTALSPPSSTPAPERRLLRTAAGPPSAVRLRRVTAALFALVGTVFGSWAARIPDVSAQVSASPAELGIALLCISVGALAAMQLTGEACARLGPGRVGAPAVALLSASVVAPGLAATPTQLCAALLLFGAGTGAANVAANSLGVVVEARCDRPLMSLLHAGFSLGGLVGALVGGLVSTAVSPSAHLLAVGAAGLLAGAVLAPTLLRADVRNGGPAPVAAAPPGTPAAVRPLVVVLGALAACTAFGVGALADWGALHLRGALEASPAVAAGGYAGFCLSMAVGRLAGGPLLQRLGDRRLLAGGALLAVAGGLLAVLSTSVAPALVGFVLVGLGLANVFPLAVGRAGAVGGASGVALASTIGYAGLLGGPPLIGLVAEHTGTALALSSVPLLAAVAVLLALRVPVEHPGLPVRAVLALPLPGQRLARVAARCRSVVDGHGRDLAVLVPAGGSSRAGRVAAYPGMEFLAV